MATKGGTGWGNNEARRCKAMAKRRDGERCNNAALKGGLVCRFHGGNTKAARAKYAENAAVQKGQEALDKAIGNLTYQPVENPLEELRRLAGEVVAWKDAIREHVQRLKDLRYSGESGEQIRGEIVLFERAMDRAGSVLGLIAKLNIDDRLVAIEEAKAAKIAGVVGAVLASFNLSVEQQLEGKREVAKALRSVG